MKFQEHEALLCSHITLYTEMKSNMMLCNTVRDSPHVFAAHDMLISHLKANDRLRLHLVWQGLRVKAEGTKSIDSNIFVLS